LITKTKFKVIENCCCVVALNINYERLNLFGSYFERKDYSQRSYYCFPYALAIKNTTA
jgi:hypothetical protein